MLLRMSSLFLRTLRDDPADAEVPAAIGCWCGQATYGSRWVFSWLPGYRVLRNVESIVRAEMDGAGFQEVHFRRCCHREVYEASGRWEEYGDTPAQRPRESDSWVDA